MFITRNMEMNILFNFFISLFFTVNGYSYTRSDSIKENCPAIYDKTFKGFIPKGNTSAGEDQFYKYLSLIS